MIAALLALLGLVLVVLPGVSGPPLRLPAAEWARLAGVALLLGFLAIEVGLTLLALPTVLRSLHAAGLASICERVLTPLSPGGEPVGWAAAVLAVVVGARAWRAGRRAHRRARGVEAEPWLGLHEDRGEFELVILPTPSLVAVSVPGPQPQVLISDGLVDRLDADQLDAVLRHEATHHRFRHWRFSFLAAAVERGLHPIPLVRRSTNALRTSLEGWADEVAADGSESGRALVRETLAAVAGPGSEPVPGCSSAPVVRARTRRLEYGAQSRSFALRVAVHAPVLTLGILGLVLVSGWVVGVHHAAALTGYCPD